MSDLEKIRSLCFDGRYFEAWSLVKCDVGMAYVVAHQPNERSGFSGFGFGNGSAYYPRQGRRGTGDGNGLQEGDGYGDGGGSSGGGSGNGSGNAYGRRSDHNSGYYDGGGRGDGNGDRPGSGSSFTRHPQLA